MHSWKNIIKNQYYCLAKAYTMRPKLNSLMYMVGQILLQFLFFNFEKAKIMKKVEINFLFLTSS